MVTPQLRTALVVLLVPAWLLWSQQRTWGPRSPATDAWDIVEAFETKGDCEARRAALGEAVVQSEPPSSATVATRYVCYPDTVDPRGPKGGG